MIFAEPDRPSAAPQAAEVVDTHMHVFRRGLPVVATPRYLPAYDAELSAYEDLVQRHGITRAVLVQPSFYGTDNRFLCEMLRLRPEQLRGIAVVAPEVEAGELDALQRAGVVGIRLNLDSLPIPDFRVGPWPDLLGELRQRGWQVELHREAADLPRLLDPLLQAGVRIVVDHFGRPSPELGVDDPGFRHLLRAAATRQVWVKLSAAYRNGTDGPAHAPALAAQLLEHFGPERLVWGSDWPHTRHETLAAMSDLLAQMTAWAPDAASRRAIFGETALALFGFEPGPRT